MGIKFQELERDARAELQQNREGTFGQAARSISRSWEYGEGKKTALKVSAGLAVSGVAIGVGAATMGIGTPIVIGLALGAFAIGQMTDLAFAKLWGRQPYFASDIMPTRPGSIFSRPSFYWGMCWSITNWRGSGGSGRGNSMPWRREIGTPLVVAAKVRAMTCKAFPLSAGPAWGWRPTEI